MTTYRSFNTAFLYAADTAFGTAAASIVTPIEGRLLGITINENNNITRSVGLGDGRNDQNYTYGPYSANFSMEYELAKFDFLQFGMGAITGSGTAVAPYYLPELNFIGYSGVTECKTFSASLEAVDIGTSTHYILTLLSCIINTIEISFEYGRPVTVRVSGFIYKVNKSSAASTTFTKNTDRLWIFSQSNFNYNGSDIGLVQSAAVSINNNIDYDKNRGLGSRFIFGYEFGLRKYDFNLTAKLQKTFFTTLHQDFQGNAAGPDTGISTSEVASKSIIFDVSEGSASTNRNGQISLTSGVIDQFSTPIAISENVIQVSMSGYCKAGITETVNKPIKWWTVP